jgi:hypothetical protein
MHFIHTLVSQCGPPTARYFSQQLIRSGREPSTKKVKLSRCTPWRRLGEEEVLPVLILNLGTRWGVNGQHHAPAELYPRLKDPRDPLDRGLGGPQSRSGRRG